MAPRDLQEVLAVLKLGGTPPPADLLVGLGAADDAAVYRLAPDLAVVETVDFFPPVVDDPWTWGAVAAVNAMSDVYAMGGEVLFALAVAGFPREMPKTIVSDVFRGGRDKVAEAGGGIAGGHTVVDAEPKYGLCVAGRVHPDRILVKGGAGDEGEAALGGGGVGGRVDGEAGRARLSSFVAHRSGDLGRTALLGGRRACRLRFGCLPTAGRRVLGDRPGAVRAPPPRQAVAPPVRTISETVAESSNRNRAYRFVFPRPRKAVATVSTPTASSTR